jgi:hypothetical protein
VLVLGVQTAGAAPWWGRTWSGAVEVEVIVGLACAPMHHTVAYDPAMLIDYGKVCSISTSVGACKGRGRQRFDEGWQSKVETQEWAKSAHPDVPRRNDEPKNRYTPQLSRHARGSPSSLMPSSRSRIPRTRLWSPCVIPPFMSVR